MSPTRVGLVGLSGRSGVFEPGLWAATAHLPSIRAAPSEFELVALANSSVESGRKSVLFHNLAPTTGTYDTAEDLAKDPNVDLVVVSVRVQKHFEFVEAAIRHGKSVFVEWPLGASLDEAEKLTALAAEAGVKTAVGLQARASNLVSVIKKVIADGKIGKVVSSHVAGNASMVPVDVWWEGLEYYLNMESGGNIFHIFFAHCRVPPVSHLSEPLLTHCVHSPRLFH